MKPLILIYSGDLEFFLLIDHILASDGFRCQLVNTIEDAVTTLEENRPCAIIVDSPFVSSGESGLLGTLKEQDEAGSIPLIMLIAPGVETDQAGLPNINADACFTRPFDPIRLLDFFATISLDKHSGESAPADAGDKILQGGFVKMNLDTYRVECNGEPVHLGPIEFKLLRHLLENPGRVVSRHELIGAAWPETVKVRQRTVDVHIGRLRQALNTAFPNELIRTERSVGYSLCLTEI